MELCMVYTVYTVMQNSCPISIITRQTNIQTSNCRIDSVNSFEIASNWVLLSNNCVMSITQFWFENLDRRLLPLITFVAGLCCRLCTTQCVLHSVYYPVCARQCVVTKLFLVAAGYQPCRQRTVRLIVRLNESRGQNR